MKKGEEKSRGKEEEISKKLGKCNQREAEREIDRRRKEVGDKNT